MKFGTVKRAFTIAIIVFVCGFNKPAMAHHNPTFGFAGTAGPIITNPASTIQKGRFTFGVRNEYVNFNEYSNDALKFFAKKKQFVHGAQHFMRPSLVAAYGVTDNFTISISFPYNVQGGIADGSLSANGTPIIIRRGTADGLGDLTLFGQYRFLNLRKHELEAAILAGITIPSGLAHVKDNVNERFGPDHQPSKRSFDPLVGLSITKRFKKKYSFDTNYLYTKAVKGIQNFYSGDLHNYNLALSYNVFNGHHHSHPKINETHSHEHTHKHFSTYHSHEHSHTHKQNWYTNLSLDSVLELNGEWRQKQKFGTLQPFGFKDEDSGGTSIYLSPGFRVGFGKNWSTYYSFGLPIIQDPHGDGQKTDFRMVFGLSKAF
jgi:hypothetical protein